MHPEGIGAPVRRREDLRFLVGQGQFVADLVLEGELACAFVRSPHAHARIDRIDTQAAAAAPGVVAVYTGADMAADGVGPMAPLWRIPGANGTKMNDPPRWTLARERVRHVGEAVAMVDCRDARSGARRRGARGGRLGAAAGGRRRARRREARRAPAPPGGPRQPRRALPARQRRRHRGGLRQGEARRRRRAHQPPHRLRRDRAARGRGRRLADPRARRPRGRDLLGDAGPAPHPEVRLRAARHSRKLGARRRTGRRRRLRHQGQALPRGDRARVGRAPSCGGRSNGCRPGARPSSAITRRATTPLAPSCALDADGRFLGLRVATLAAVGRPHLDRRGGGPDHRLHRRPLRPLPDPRDRRRRERPLHQYRAHRRLPGRRAPRGVLRPRAAGRGGGGAGSASTASSCGARTSSRRRQCRTRPP